MKHNKLIAVLATAGGLFTFGSAQACAPAAAAGIAAIFGAAAGTAANQAHQQPPAVAVVPAPSTVVLGGPPATVQESIPAPRDGYRWQQGHFEIRNGVSTWVTGHWVADDTVMHTTQ